MLDAVDVANTPTDTDDATELPSSSPASMETPVIHTKLDSPKRETTLEGSVGVLTGPGTPIPWVFQQNLEPFLNKFAVTDRTPRKEYLRLRKDDRVIGSVLVQSSCP